MLWTSDPRLMAMHRSPGQAAQVDCTLPRRAPEVVDIGRDGFEANPSPGLLGIDFAVERLPAATHVERRVVRFAKQQREIGGAFILQGLNGRIERNAGVSAAPAVLAGQNAADSAGPKLASIPFDLAAIDADMADDTVGFILNQRPQLGMGKDDAGPGQLCDDMGRPDRLEQRFCQWPRGVPVQNVDFDAHFTSRSRSGPIISSRAE